MEISRVPKLTETETTELKELTAHVMPDNPSAIGWSAAKIKAALTKAIVGEDKYNVVALIDRVVGDMNVSLGEVESGLNELPPLLKRADNVLGGFERAEAHADTVDSGERAQAILTEDETGTEKKYVFHFKIPRGATGERGATGKNFSIAKTYGSVDEMRAAFATDGLEEGSFVLISTKDVEDEDNAKLFVKTESGYNELSDLSGATGIQGETGYTPEFKVIDGQCYVKRSADSEFELLGWDVVTLAENFSVGEAEAITRGSVAMGDGSVAGARGFGVTSFDPTNRQIKIALKSPATGAYASPAYASGDYFSILNGTHFAFCGKIESVSVSGDTATITYTPTTTHGTNSSRTDPWWVYDPRTILYTIRAIFWVPEKPLVGYDLEYEGEVAFPNATALGGGFASAKGAFVNGEGSAAGGNHAAIFGPLIRAAYGNLSSGRENFSIGLHSALLGRWLTNYVDYAFKAGRGNVVDEGVFQFAYGTKERGKNVFSVDENGNGLFFGCARADSYTVLPKYDMVSQFRTHSEFNNDPADTSVKDGTFEWDADICSAVYRATNKPNWIQRHSPNGFADGNIYKYVKVRYMVPSETTEDLYQALIWRSVNVPTGDNKAILVPDGIHTTGTYDSVKLIADGQWHDLVYDMSANALWSGSSITLIRWANAIAFSNPIYVSQFGLFKSYAEAIAALPQKEVATVDALNAQLSTMRTTMESALINGSW